MALADYTPSLLWFADSLADLDEPTGATKTTPVGTTDPSLTGSPDSYADFTGSNGVTFTPVSPVGEVGAGDITIILKMQLDTSSASDIIAENWDGSGTADTNSGWQIVNATGTSRSVGLCLPPVVHTSERISCSLNTLVLGQPFIMAFRRASSVWTLWLDVDASGGMTSDTPAANSIEQTGVINECGDVTFGCARAGTAPFDGRIYWLVQIDAAVNDTDIQLADWDNETNLKTAWLAPAAVVYLSPMTLPLTNTRLRM